MSVWNLEPERKLERARDAVAGVIARVKALLETEVASLGPDDVEILALQLKLANVNLNVAARDLRAVEEERRFLAREQEREAMRFEKEDDGTARDWNTAEVKKSEVRSEK